MNCPWLALVAALAQWFRNLLVRKDVHGKYIPPARRKDPKKTSFTEKAEPTEEILMAHFSGNDVIGLFLINYEGQCRMGVVDIDRHDEKGSPEVNEKAAITLYDRAISKGFSPLLEDSDGRGGFKLWLIFSEPVPARWVRRFAFWLIQDWKELGLENEPEIFPKQDNLEPGKFGNFVRLPGRHHTFLNHWSRIWDGTKWLDGEAAALKILDTEGSPASIISDDFRCDPPAPTASSAPSPARKAKSVKISIGLIRSAIKSLPSGFPNNYDDWLKVGMSLHDLGEVGLQLWVEISQKCPKYRAGACEVRWQTFEPDGGLTWKTVLYFATQNGWKPSACKKVTKPKEDAKGKPSQKEHKAPTKDVVQVALPIASEEATAQNSESSRELPVAKGDPTQAQVASQSDGTTNSKVSNGNGTNRPVPPGGAGVGSSHKNPQNRPEIIWNNRPPDEVTEEALETYKDSTRSKKIFSRGGVLVRIVTTELGPRTEVLSEEALEGILARIAVWKIYRGKDKDGNDKFEITPPQSFVVRDIIALGEYDPTNFPPLKGIVRCPYFAPDGSFVDRKGYHAGSGYYYDPDPALVVPSVSLSPSNEELKEAKRWLVDEMLGDFKFKTPGDLANALACLFTPLVRNLFDGPTPFFLIQAPEKGTGKSLLARCLAGVAVGRVSSSPQPENDAEWRKAITTYLIGSPQVVFFDNLSKKLDSPSLERVINFSPVCDVL